MRVPRAVARFNRRITNPLAVRFGGWAPLNGTLEHVGRKSGKTYRTPLNIFETADGFVIPIGYGLESHWVQNALAGGPLTIHKAGRTVPVANAHIVSKADAEKLVIRGRTMFRLHPYNEAALVVTAT
ncbi:nitroreductase family deazaflavin-dependent oxidoreductase [Mycolicibacterium sp. 120270]|uniref:nitroreductase family deazaflavin-dependent oxidoreductase n=1 Tax=Mycolicibacterium sp. 120270 TaxID=3090600 RepID=UPI00299CE58E|nr:nitroreductase family deazaflavin-dependent oxidoreductase [Mycolicibacterium sp. 120270]MDX1886545.1 nitroreductase family deazaflavin-dependent oxidoreductase [Mycolicibacterium sp. 120270]